MRILCCVFCLLALPRLNNVRGAQAEPTDIPTEQLRERGVLFYVPFEGTTDATLAAGQATPWVARDVLFTAGVFGQGAQLLHKPSRYATMPSGKLQKYKNAQSILIYEALGNVYRRRGTLAFWVLSPWDATDSDLLTGSSLTGPSVIGISARDVYPAFLSFTRRKSFFELRFGGTSRAGPLERFGTFGQPLIPRWKANHWHHVAVTWDDRRGYALYHNGEVVQRHDGDIEWDLLQPDTIALGSRPLPYRDLWPVYHDYVFDELIVFSRPLPAEEVVLVRDGRHTELRPVTSEDWPFDADARRQSLNLTDSPGRPAVTARAPGGARLAIRQWAVEAVEMNYHRRFALVDGSATSSVQFRDGGLSFDVPAVFRFARPVRINHAIPVVDSPNDSYMFDAVPAQQVCAVPAGRSHVPLPARERDRMGVFFKGDSVGREVSFFDVRTDGQATPSGRRFALSGAIDANRFADASRALLESPHPGDRPVFLASADAGDGLGPVTRGAMQHTFIVLESVERDRFVDSLRLLLPIRPAREAFVVVVRVHDPLITGRIVLDLDVAATWPAAGEALPLDMTLGTPGLIIPPGGHLVLDVISDSDYEIVPGADDRGAFVEVHEGDSGRIGHEFAQAQLRRMWDGFLRRVNQNRFMQRGETEQTNPIFRALSLAEKYDPTNGQVQAWWGWSRLRPWPAHDFAALDAQTGPRWAVYLREAVRSMQDVIHWWLDHRAHPNGYLVGAGNQWNDITKLYNKYLCLGALAGDQRLTDAVERYLDAHWNTGRMVQGYTYSLTDMTHSAEEASFIQPALHVLRPGVPRHVYRDLLTASNYPRWIGVNEYGHTHFRSNFINAGRMLTDGVQGRDFVGCETPTVPGRFLWWYNGHPPTARLLTAYTDSWLADALRETKEKAKGAVPWSVQFETDKLFNTDGNKALMFDNFLALYQMTGDRKYLGPVATLLRDGAALGGQKWRIHYGGSFVQYRLVSGSEAQEEQFRELSTETYDYLAEDGFYQRGIEQVEGQALCRWAVDHDEEDLLSLLRFVIRNNRRSFVAYTLTDPPTDRVYPWGRMVLPVLMLGGRLFDQRAADPQPSAAVVWEGIDTDVVSLVFERGVAELKMLVHSFGPAPVRAGLRVLHLPEGRYRLARAAAADGARSPDGEPTVSEVELRRFSATALELPSRRTLWVELRLLEEREKKLRPDLAVTLAAPVDGGAQAVARVHNLGCVAVRSVCVRLRGGSGNTLAEATVPEVPGLTAYAPQTRDVALKIPDGAAEDACSLVVDPQDAIDEINEANNTCALSRGVPPPVESAPERGE